MINKLSRFIICAAAFTALLPTSSFANVVKCSVSTYTNFNSKECTTPYLAVPPNKSVILSVDVFQRYDYLPEIATVGVQNLGNGNILWTKKVSADLDYRLAPIKSKRYLKAYIKDVNYAPAPIWVYLKYVN